MGWSADPKRRYVSWVKNDVNQFGLYLFWCFDLYKFDENIALELNEMHLSCFTHILIEIQYHVLSHNNTRRLRKKCSIWHIMILGWLAHFIWAFWGYKSYLGVVLHTFEYIQYFFGILITLSVSASSGCFGHISYARSYL